jgi:hypothetical protein
LRLVSAQVLSPIAVLPGFLLNEQRVRHYRFANKAFVDSAAHELQAVSVGPAACLPRSDAISAARRRRLGFECATELAGGSGIISMVH